MIYVKVTFEDGNSLKTGINTDLDGAKKYYVGKSFELDECKPLVKAVSVELIDEKMNTIKTYLVTKSEAQKVTITISRKQLWFNYVECWKDVIVGDYNCSHIDFLKEVADVLLGEERLDALKIRKLFRDGNTPMLLGGAMEEIEGCGRDVLREINIIDENKTVIVRHEDINF